MKVRGTQRHDFQCHKIQALLESGALDREDATRILGEALHVICGLRGQVACMREASRQTADMGKSIWMEGAQ